MHLEYKERQLSAYFRLSNQLDLMTENLVMTKGLNHLFWNQSTSTIELEINHRQVKLAPNHITTATELQNVTFNTRDVQITCLSFNREFYCIKDHQEEVSCNGVIFYGTQDIPLIHLDESESQKMQSLFEVFEEEFDTKDVIQGEMLQLLLTRLIIKCTRLAKAQLIIKPNIQDASDIIRVYTALVDKHFREMKNIADYADLLHKSPKTLSNAFSKHSDKTPLRVIHDRVIQEAQYQLLNSNKTAKEVSHSLGFEDASAFNKLFKKITGCAPIDYKKSKKKLT
ncbi:AraC-type DNA-binding protein [Reichenbachiella agariperforans]|uniref:AraC-type DNA-binding protein n=1 Tax=Reichenbachiella agariperforans TaxID=156994 RepID=A0A1M6TEH3_REIAG|nr:AraC family transcriptional regulator [Reichenbachiella agariperforans]SHK55363.1 AraC-type DNA-binding protein [Reichenbachiella agariperforans]